MATASPEHSRHDIALLLRLLRQPGSADPSWPQITDWDWGGFAEACDYHQVTPFVYCRLQGLSGVTIPSGLKEQLRKRFLEVSGRNYHLARKLTELTSLLEEHEIPVLAFKGPTLAMAAYGDLALRWYQDLDVLVRVEHLPKAADVMTRYGYEITRDWWNPSQPENPRYVARHHEIPLRAPDKSYFVDLHWQLADYKVRAFRLDVEEVWGRPERIELLQKSVSTLCREDLFLMLCCHGSWHGWVCLKWLLDIAELLRNSQTLNWSRIEDTTRSRPLVRASASLAILLARELLDIDVPPLAAQILPATARTRKVGAAILYEIRSRGHSSASNGTALLGLEGSPLGWMKYLAGQTEWLCHQVFVQVSPHERALVELPEGLHFLYHFIRPARLVYRFTRRAARALWSH
jgi:hypothetical protein